jgi:serine/threonine-protein kinase RsbW
VSVGIGRISRGLVDITAAPDPSTIPTDGPDCVCWPARDADTATGFFHANETARPEAVRALRRGLHRWVTETEIDEDIAEAMVLLTDEAVTNVVEHAMSDELCTVEVVAGPRVCGDGIAVLVRDDGQWRPQPEDRGYRGRGVTLMGRMAQRCSITTSPDGTTVRMCWPSA